MRTACAISNRCHPLREGYPLDWRRGANISSDKVLAELAERKLGAELRNTQRSTVLAPCMIPYESRYRMPRYLPPNPTWTVDVLLFFDIPQRYVAQSPNMKEIQAPGKPRQVKPPNPEPQTQNPKPENSKP